MNYKKSVDELFCTLGEDIKVSIDGKMTQTKALIQPMRYKNKMYLEPERTELGFKDSECFLYLGPAEQDFTGKESSTVIESADRCYKVSRADRIALGGITQYIWAVLAPRYKDGVFDAL